MKKTVSYTPETVNSKTKSLLSKLLTSFALVSLLHTTPADAKWIDPKDEKTCTQTYSKIPGAKLLTCASNKAFITTETWNIIYKWQLCKCDENWKVKLQYMWAVEKTEKAVEKATNIWKKLWKELWKFFNK